MKNIKHTLKLAALAGALALAPLAVAQTAYPTPEAAADALVDAIARHDGDAIKAVVGPDFRKYIPASNYDPEDVTNFLEAWARAHDIVRAGDGKAYLAAGGKGWTMPVPIVKTAAGWQFDTRLARRKCASAALVATSSRDPGRACLHGRAEGVPPERLGRRRRQGVLDAGAVVTREAQRTVLGLAARRAGRARSARSSRRRKSASRTTGTCTGSHGARDERAGRGESYIKNGRLTEGFALVAWPAKFGDTGVMTFIVNQDGIVYQKSLGPNTDAAARAMKSYDPDASWQKASPDAR